MTSFMCMNTGIFNMAVPADTGLVQTNSLRYCNVTVQKRETSEVSFVPVHDLVVL